MFKVYPFECCKISDCWPDKAKEVSGTLKLPEDDYVQLAFGKRFLKRLGLFAFFGSWVNVGLMIVLFFLNYYIFVFFF